MGEKGRYDEQFLFQVELALRFAGGWRSTEFPRRGQIVPLLLCAPPGRPILSGRILLGSWLAVG